MRMNGTINLAQRGESRSGICWLSLKSASTHVARVDDLLGDMGNSCR
jgi:hypothetical protein